MKKLALTNLGQKDNIFTLSDIRAGYILIGDSILANSTYGTTINSLTAEGLEITCNLNSNSLITQGMPIFISRVDQTEYNGYFTVKSRISATSFTYDVRTIPNITIATFDGQGVFKAVSKLLNVCIPELANAFSGQKLKYLGSHAAGGTRLPAIIDSVKGAVELTGNAYNEKPTIIFANGGINDVIDGDSYEQIQDRLIQYFDELSSYDIQVVFIPLLPIDDSTSSSIIARLNYWTRYYLSSNPNIFVANTDIIAIDPANTSGNYKTNYSTDGVHPSNTACHYMAIELNDRFLSKLQKHDNKHSISLSGRYLNDVLAPQLADNQLMLTGVGDTGVTAGTGISGTVPDNYKIRGGGSSQTAVCSLISRDDGVGNDLQVILTASVDGDSFHILPDSPNNLNSRVSVGDKIYATMSVEVTGITGSLRGVELKIQHTKDGFISQTTSNENSGTTPNLEVTSIPVMRLQTPVYTVQGDETLLTTIALFTFNTAGSATFKITDYSLINLSKIMQ